MRARPADWPALSLLIPALGTVEQPTPPAEDTLRHLIAKSDDANIRTTAQLSLGIMARSLADIAPERTQRIVKDAVAQLRAATTDADRRQMLLVLGNIGAPETLDLITSYVADASPEVRVAAVGALRWLDAEAVDQLLMRVLASDADAAVRAEAAGVIGLRPVSPRIFAGQKLALVSALARDDSPTVRLALLNHLARAARMDADLPDLLSRVAAEDASEEVRNEAARLLDGASR
jgi:HEAT repeat protein